MGRLCNILGILLVFLLVFSAGMVSAEENLVQNGDFEAFAVGETPESWELWERERGLGQIYVDDSTSFSGNKSLLIHNTGTKDWSAHYPGIPDNRTTDPLPVGGNQALYVSVAIKVEGDDQTWGALDIQQHSSPDENAQTRSYLYPSGTRVRGNTDWVLLEDVIVTDPDTVCIRVRLSGGGTGKVWFDDVVVRPADASAVKEATQVQVLIEEAPVPVEVLTPGPRDNHVYYTHRAFSPDSNYLWYQGQRAGVTSIYVLDLTTGQERMLVPGVGTGSCCLNPSGTKLYYVRGSFLFSVDFPSGENMTPVTRFDAQWTNLGHPTFTKSDNALYLPAVERLTGKYHILKVDLVSGTVESLGDLPFQWITHLQGNPAEDETLMFCDQRGDWMIPQRMWLINTDGSGLRPLYDQRPEDWVTHECWSYDGTFVTFVLHPIGLGIIDKDNTGFRLITPVSGDSDQILSPAAKELRARAVVEDYPDWSITTDRLGVGRAYSDSAQGLPVIWHASPSPDGQWAVTDTHQGDILLVHLETGKIYRIARNQWQRGSSDHPHPAFAPNGTHVYWAQSDAAGTRLVWADVSSLMVQREDNVNLRGQVRSWRTGEPVPEATLLVVDTEETYTVNNEGYFDLSLPAGATLEVSAPGYSPRTIALTDALVGNVVIDIDLFQTGEELVFAANFEGYATGKLPPSFGLENPSTMSEAVWQVGRVYSRPVLWGGPGELAYIRTNPMTITADKVAIDFYYLAGPAGNTSTNTHGYLLRDWPPAFHFTMLKDTISFSDGTKVSVPTGDFIRVRMILHGRTNTADLYVNDLSTPVKEGIPFRTPIDNLNNTYFRLGKEEGYGQDYWANLYIVALDE
ncbi:MAG TPA: hypothetical protein GXX57_06740 [Firmicutes bacterium]|nr:hypothetical protein [Bacillota bacterium]